MIGYLEGRVSAKQDDRLLVMAGPVGLWVSVPRPLWEQTMVGETWTGPTHLVVREDALALYGFATTEERDLFVTLLGVNGVGPRLALSILSTLTPAAIRRAVFQEQPEVFHRVPGVGRKTAQKILLHLQDVLQPEEALGEVAALAEVDAAVLDALVALGYSVVEAQAALQSLPKEAPPDVEERLRLALRYFSR